MVAVTIKEARAHLNKLIEAAARGEQVVLMRGSKHVAALIPISAADLELSPRLSDEQASRFWSEVAQQRKTGSRAAFSTASEAVQHLEKRAGTRSRRTSARRR